ncbi:MAG: hypothetical protein ACM335_02205 [Deltaproteobacteria bacterium]
MSKSRKTKKPAGATALTPEEQRLLDGLLEDLSLVEPDRLAERIGSPLLAEALAGRLPVTDPHTPKILLGLRASFRDKSVQKAIKKAAFRLKQKGFVLPEAQDSQFPALRAGKQSESEASVYLGPIDGTGSRAVFVSIPQTPGGVDLAIGVVNDEEGLVEFSFAKHSKKRLREIKEIFFSNLPNMVETTLSHAADVLERAYRAKGSEVSESARAYLRFRPWLLENASGTGLSEVYRLLPAESISPSLLTESQLQRLFQHEFMASWFVDPKSLKPLIEEIGKAEESRIFITEGQRLEHIRRIKYEGIQKVFSETRRLRLKYRLEETALVFLKSAEESLARLCLAAASSLAAKESPVTVNPFIEFLLERSLSYYLKESRESEPPSDLQSRKLIVS